MRFSVFLRICGSGGGDDGPCARAARIQAVAAPGAGPKAAGIAAACRANVLAKTPDAARALDRGFPACAVARILRRVKRAVFERMAGEKLGRMKEVADQTLTGGELATGGTWLIKLKAANLKGKVKTVPAWCRSLRSAPDACSCESPLRTE